MTEKITKKQTFELIKSLLSDNSTIVEFCDKEIAALDTKAAKAKAYASSKKAEVDPLTEAIKATLTDELRSIPDICGSLEGEEITVNKVSSRLSKLVAANEARKEQIVIEKGRKVMAYAKA